MKRAFTASLATAVTLLAVSLLGVAAAEAPTGAVAVRTLSVEGTGTLPLPTSSSAAVATAVYREAAAKAIADGQAKAAFLAGKSGVTPGVIDSLVEDGGYIECSNSSGSGYAEYEGEQPDFGNGSRAQVSGAVPLSAAAAPATGAPTVSHRPKVRRKHPTAKKAAAASCNLTANVSLIYAIS
jgi:hypothetical protein